MTIEAAVQMLRGGGEVFHSHLFPRDASAALRVHAVPTALLITCERQRGGQRRRKASC